MYFYCWKLVLGKVSFFTEFNEQQEFYLGKSGNSTVSCLISLCFFAMDSFPDSTKVEH